MAQVIVHERPQLNSPYLIAGFEGWPDAGKVSSGTIRYLRDKLHAKRFAEIDPADFYIFQSPGVELLRPSTVIEEGRVKQLSFPSTYFWAWHNEQGEHDLVLVRGIEPQLRWQEYIDALLDLAQELGVLRVYSIGGTYDRVPHTREPLISAVANDPALEAELMAQDIRPTSYSGPASVHTLLMVSATARKLKSASIWGHAPHYIQAPNDKVCHSLLKRLSAMLEIAIDLEDLRKEGEELDEQVNRAMTQKPELADYVNRLEEEYGRSEKREFPELSAPEEIIKEVEDFLRGEGNSEE